MENYPIKDINLAEGGRRRMDWAALGYFGDPMTWGGRDKQTGN